MFYARIMKSLIIFLFAFIQHSLFALDVDRIQLFDKSEKYMSVNNYSLYFLFTFLFLGLYLLFKKNRKQIDLIKENEKKIRKLNKLHNRYEKKLDSYKTTIVGLDDERINLAKEVHSGLGGLLSSSKMQLSQIENIYKEGLEFENSMSLLDQASVETRRLSYTLMPGTLVKFGLIEALLDFCNNQNTSTLSINFQSVGFETRLALVKEIMIYRIIEELVFNCIKHAKAKEVIVQLMLDEKRLFITVEDDGIGFDIKQTHPLCFGLNNIRARVDYLNAKLDIDSEIDVGTSVSIEIELIDEN
jgi:signal transduction histidine kinase